MAVKEPIPNQTVRVKDMLDLYKSRLDKVEADAMFANAVVLKLNRKIAKLKGMIPADKLKNFEEDFEKEENENKQ